MPSPLFVTARFAVKPVALEEMRSLLAELSEKTRQEPGCLEYAYYQSLDDPLEFSSFELWQSPECEARHWQTRHLQDALARAAGLLQVEPHIQRYQRLV
ncbi:antibiotic biosynthesis monooxygenase [Pseudomonas sp. BN417]|uniref:putative quinol monooxygenase n=1 Tax=Pseudomonas sp. BN417 TaxID=2567890 RepID=UPI00245662A8|nr:putative quinol monooxygenase [Pseudomonas sp. BN417]MDH4559099.1 antibiotic biosynthesis monooxygenase [Pseudomonas sp. BN417]